MAASVTIECAGERTTLMDKTLEILRRTIRERCGIEMADCDQGDCRVVLAMKDGIGAEGFAIENGPGGAVQITGNDERGLLYGVGKFLRNARYAEGDFQPGAWCGTSVPVKEVRGIYFATHFHNFYHEAPVEEIERYVEELALWGCNVLCVWFDMHDYDGIDDPVAQKMIERLHRILQAANAVGIGAALMVLANEGYNNSPEELRADDSAGHDGYHEEPGGFYHREICPSTDDGLEHILKTRDEMFKAFADLDLRYICIWPYDQGGCTCSTCAPWGANGFLRVAEPVAGLVRKHWPRAKIVLSTWYFNHFIFGEWEGISAAFERDRPKWIDYLLIDDFDGFPDYPLKHGVPGGFSVVNFAEISMVAMYPWGGFGANPRPGHWQTYWDKGRDMVTGGFPYSEGIYEDINKVIMFQFGWSPGRAATDIVREYLSYEFSSQVADDVLRAIQLMEAGQAHRLRDDWADCLDEAASEIYGLDRTSQAEECFDIIQAADAKLTAWTRGAWRWRILYLRAALDAELRCSGGTATEKTEAYFNELADIYHADRAELTLLPPSVRLLTQTLTERTKREGICGD